MRLRHGPALLRLQASGREYIRWLTFQRVGNPGNVEESDIPLAAFDFSHVGAVYPSCIGQGFLRERLSLPGCPHSVT